MQDKSFRATLIIIIIIIIPRACFLVGYGTALCHTMARRLVPYLVWGYGTGLVPYYGTGACAILWHGGKPGFRKSLAKSPMADEHAPEIWHG